MAFPGALTFPGLLTFPGNLLPILDPLLLSGSVVNLNQFSGTVSYDLFSGSAVNLNLYAGTAE